MISCSFWQTIVLFNALYWIKIQTDNQPFAVGKCFCSSEDYTKKKSHKKRKDGSSGRGRGGGTGRRGRKPAALLAAERELSGQPINQHDMSMDISNISSAIDDTTIPHGSGSVTPAGGPSGAGASPASRVSDEDKPLSGIVGQDGDNSNITLPNMSGDEVACLNHREFCN